MYMHMIIQNIWCHNEKVICMTAIVQVAQILTSKGTDFQIAIRCIGQTEDSAHIGQKYEEMLLF